MESTPRSFMFRRIFAILFDGIFSSRFLLRFYIYRESESRSPAFFFRKITRFFARVYRDCCGVSRARAEVGKATAPERGTTTMPANIRRISGRYLTACRPEMRKNRDNLFAATTRCETRPRYTLHVQYSLQCIYELVS